jgi:EpsI family protein
VAHYDRNGSLLSSSAVIINFTKVIRILGKKREIKYLALMVIFFCTGLVVYTFEQSAVSTTKPPLKNHLQEVSGYTNLRNIELAKDVYDMLNLDDYFFSDFKRNGSEVNLYIGYYYSAAKAYAAHSPLICYPSQGWQIDRKPLKGKLEVGGHTIHYEEIITSLGGQQELVLYWYQARLQTNNQVYRNKIDMGYNKFKYDDEQHGFVRVAVSFPAGNYKKAQEEALAFVKAFYIQFVEYIEGKSVEK